MQLIKKLTAYRVVPVITIDDAKDAKELAKALVRGGLPCAEVTFRTDAAEESIRIMKEERLLVGAGTVLSIEQADKAINAGAEFIVCPGMNPMVVKHCLSKNMPVIPGCITPTEIEAAMEMGLIALKFFPAEAAGGVKMLKALSAPYPNIRFMPTGGVSPANLQDYLLLPNVFCCGGSWITDKKLINTGNFNEIARLAEEASR